MAVKTGHPLVDTLFSRKYIIADEKGIDMDFTVNDLTDLAMENGHLVVLLSNLMDNAIEACERVESGREVRASFLLQDNEVFLSVRNTSLPVQITDGGIVSSKSDGLDVYKRQIQSFRLCRQDIRCAWCGTDRHSGTP